MSTLLRDYQILHQEFTTLVNEYMIIDKTTTYAESLRILALEKYILITGTDPGSLQYMVTNYFGNSTSNYYTHELGYIHQMQQFIIPYYFIGALTVPLSPNRLAIDSSGNIYFTDKNVSVIKILTPDGKIGTIAGTGVSGYSGDGGLAILAQINFPQGIAVDNSGNIYFADTYNNRIRKITNGIITTIAGTGGSNFTGDNYPAINAQLNGPYGVAVDNSGNIYIADTTNNRIRKITNDGIIRTIAGNGYAYYYGNEGAAVDAVLQAPTDVALDPLGDNLFIADSGNNLIRVVPMNNDIINFGLYMSQNHIYTIGGPEDASASSNAWIPNSLTVYESNVYACDANNYCVLKISASDGSISSAIGFSSSSSSSSSFSQNLNGIIVTVNGMYFSSNNFTIQFMNAFPGTFYGVFINKPRYRLTIAGNNSPD